MKHARDDYAPIQDPRGEIPDDEPVLLIRGQDVCAIPTLDAYVTQALNHGADPRIIVKLGEQRKRIIAWQRDKRVKIPDLPQETLG